jgi:type I restriction enzyme S subunit
LKAQRTQLRAISGGGSTKGALTCQDVRGFKISIPPSEEQINILSYVNKLLKLHERISESNNDIDRLKEFAQNIISKSVTGSI